MDGPLVMLASVSFTTSELFLIALWLLVGFWNSSIGPTGGVIFASMASLLPPSVAIPLQSVVEAGSGILRTWVLRLFIDWQFLLIFMFSSAIGFATGMLVRIVATPSEDMLRLVMGTSILITIWLPAAKAAARHRTFPWLVGSATAFIGLFASGIGSFIAAAVAMKHEDHRCVVASLSASLIYQHSVKIIIFGALGFSFHNYAHLLIGMLVAALCGTWLGARFALKVSQRFIKPVFTGVVTVLALNLIWSGLTA